MGCACSGASYEAGIDRNAPQGVAGSKKPEDFVSKRIEGILQSRGMAVNDFWSSIPQFRAYCGCFGSEGTLSSSRLPARSGRLK